MIIPLAEMFSVPFSIKAYFFLSKGRLTNVCFVHFSDFMSKNNDFSQNNSPLL